MSPKNTLLVLSFATLFALSINAGEKGRQEDPGLTKALQPLRALREEVDQITADRLAGKITVLQAALRLKELKRLIEAATN